MELSGHSFLPSRGGRGGGRGARGRGGADRHNFHGGSGERALGMVIDKSSRVHFSNVPVSVLEKDGSEALRPLFEDYGPIERYVLFTDNTGRLTGSGMCTYRNPADAKMAIYRLHEREMDDSTKLSVVMAKEHGVVTAENVRRQMREEKHGEGADEGKWGHDLYDSIENGGRVKGLPGWAASRYKEATRTEVKRFGSSQVDAQFEKYVQERDEQRQNPTPAEEQPPQQTSEEQQPQEQTMENSELP